MVLVKVAIAVTVVLVGTIVLVDVVTTVTLGLNVNVADLVDVGILFVDFVDCFVTQPVREKVETVPSTKAGAMAAKTATIKDGFMVEMGSMVLLEVNSVVFLICPMFDTELRSLLYSTLPCLEKSQQTSHNSLDPQHCEDMHCTSRQASQRPKAHEVLAGLRQPATITWSPPLQCCPSHRA